MHVFALVVALLVFALGIALGSRFLLAPRTATLGYGVAPDDVRALTQIKGVRAHGGKLSTALGIHGVTAALLIAAGLVLALG